MVCESTSSSALCVTLQIKIWWRKVKTYWFGSTKCFLVQRFCTVSGGLERTLQTLTPAREECNKYDLTAAPSFWLANHDDWSRWFAISSLLPVFAVPVLLLWVGLGKKKTKLGCEKYFCRVT
jgi:hypothetical protein